MPLIAVIMPNYDKGAYIRAAIESVLAQSLSDFELIIVDDASTNDSVAVVNEYSDKDSRVKLLRNSKNLGVSAALNLGVRSSRSDLVCFMGSDDMLTSDRLKVQVDALNSSKRVSVAYSDAPDCRFECNRSASKQSEKHPKAIGNDSRQSASEDSGFSWGAHHCSSLLPGQGRTSR